MAQSDNKGRNTFNIFLITVIGQMGCLAVLVIAVSILAGLWLDNFFHTKPVITLVLLLAGVPVSVFLMVFVARRSVAKLRIQNENEKKGS